MAFNHYPFNGYNFQFTGVKTYKMRVFDERRRKIGVFFASWLEQKRDPDTGRLLQRVWIQNRHELAACLQSSDPFAVVLLEEKEGTEAPNRKMERVVAFLLVRSIGMRIDDKSVWTKVIAEVPPAGTDPDFFRRYGIECVADEDDEAA